MLQPLVAEYEFSLINSLHYFNFSDFQTIYSSSSSINASHFLPGQTVQTPALGSDSPLHPEAKHRKILLATE